MSDIVSRLLVLASGKKSKKKKYNKEVENAFDDLLVYLVEVSSYTKNDRALRLLMRIQKALSSEGYGFKEKVAPVPNVISPSSGGRATQKKHLVCSGGLCTLLKTKPEYGLDRDAIVRLVEYLGSKQCYKFEISPREKSLLRKTGQNYSLPKPLTWAKLENHGVVREPIVTADHRILMEEFLIDGVRAYTFDRVSFYSPNAGMCRRWVEGLDRAIDSVLNK